MTGLNDELLEAAACLWEAVLEIGRNTPSNTHAAGDTREEEIEQTISNLFSWMGTSALRLEVTGMAPFVCKAFEVITDGGEAYDLSFDWDFCPAFLIEGVDWSGDGASWDSEATLAWGNNWRASKGLDLITLDDWNMRMTFSQISQVAASDSNTDNSSRLRETLLVVESALTDIVEREGENDGDLIIAGHERFGPKNDLTLVEIRDAFAALITEGALAPVQPFDVLWGEIASASYSYGERQQAKLDGAGGCLSGYAFATSAEHKAFCLGVTEADGWAGATVFGPGENHGILPSPAEAA